MDTDPSQTPQSTRSLKSAASTPRSQLTFTPDTTDLSSIGELLNGVRHSVVALTQAFDSLQPAEPGHNPTKGPNANVNAMPVDAAQQIHTLRKQLVAQDRTQEGHITKIKELIRVVLMDQISVQLRKHLREMVREQVGQTVRERVAAQIARQVGPDLSNQMASHREQMRVVKESLHNAEARRTNAMIRSTELAAPLSRILKTDGESSAIFPSTLVDLFSMPVPAVHALMEEYGVPHDKEDPRETDLNKVMQFIGVTLQMVPAPWSSGAPLITNI